jgi:hypothetical protein
MLTLFNLILPSLVYGRVFSLSPFYYNTSYVAILKMSKRKRSSIVAIAKETPIPTPALSTKSSNATKSKPPSEEPDSTTKQPKRRRAKPDSKAQPTSDVVVKDGIEGLGDPEAEGDELADEEEIKEALSRPPPVNSDYLPLPWKGRLGYVRFTLRSIK